MEGTVPEIGGSQALDVAIGLFFIFFLLSVVCSGISEGIATALAWRSEDLLKGLRGLLADETALPNRPKQASGQATAKAATSDAQERQPQQPTLGVLLDHPLVRALVDETARREIRRKVPSYLPSQTFALALIDTVAPDASAKARAQNHDLIAEVGDRVKQVSNQHVREVLQALLSDARGDIDKFRQGVERWFDSVMERVSGWYKRRVQLWLWIIAAVVTIALNADSVQIANQLWKDDTLRAAVVTQAQQAVEQGDSQPDVGAGASTAQKNGTLTQQIDRVNQLKLPIGWSVQKADPRWPDDLVGWVGKLLGLGITTVALTLGAPFWFDLLGRVARLRGTGGPRPSGPA